jgi:hypothetical protein
MKQLAFTQTAPLNQAEDSTATFAVDKSMKSVPER